MNIKYSLILSTLGKRESMEACLANFNWFVLNRNDTELIIATSNRRFNPDVGRVLHLESTGEQYFMWRQGCDAAAGEWIVILGDDCLLSQNFLDRCDRLITPNTKVFQPALLDPQGYVICSEYFRSYTVAAVRNAMVKQFNLGTELWCDTLLLQSIYDRYRNDYYFDAESFVYHYGYPIEGGIEAAIGWWDHMGWIKGQRKRNDYRRIEIDDGFFPGYIPIIHDKPNLGVRTLKYILRKGWWLIRSGNPSVVWKRADSSR